MVVPIDPAHPASTGYIHQSLKDEMWDIKYHTTVIDNYSWLVILDYGIQYVS